MPPEMDLPGIPLLIPKIPVLTTTLVIRMLTTPILKAPIPIRKMILLLLPVRIKRHPRTETPHRVTLLRKNWMALILPKTGRNHLTDSIKMITLQRIVTQIVIPTVNPQICRTEMPDRATEMEVPAVATVVWAVATVIPAVEWKRQPITISFRSVVEKFTSTQAVTALTPTEI